MMNKSKFIRTTSLKEIGVLGQDKLLVSRVFIVGIGGLGNQILLHLSSLGIDTFSPTGFIKNSGLSNKYSINLSALQK